MIFIVLERRFLVVLSVLTWIHVTRSSRNIHRATAATITKAKLKIRKVVVDVHRFCFVITFWGFW